MTAQQIADVLDVDLNRLKENREAMTDFYAAIRKGRAKGEAGFAPIFPDTCYHLTHYWPAAADIPVASDNPVHYADA
ncbi:hypothetical protein ACLEYA_20945, partial [Escherichia marmotae]